MTGRLLAARDESRCCRLSRRLLLYILKARTFN